jgi:hypothetical protein
MTTITAIDQKSVPIDTHTTARGVFRSAARIVWGVALIGIVLGAVDGYFMIEAAQSGPQQAAGAAMACLYVITPYVFARAFEKLGR